MRTRGVGIALARPRRSVILRFADVQDIDAAEVTVEVQSGKVQLEGTVPERWMKHVVEDVADGCPGVEDVENRIRVQSQSGEGTGASTSAYGTTSSSASTRAKKE
jgi:hypothetical protein